MWGVPMERKKIEKNGKAGLGVSVDEQHKGLRNLDFFADHSIVAKNMRYNSNQVSTMGPLYLRTALATITCPKCNGKVKRNIRNHPREWFLKFVGRKILYCTNCDWKETIKEGRWEWEAILGAVIAFLIVCFAVIQWIIH